MANRWTIESAPDQEEKYDWHLPNNDQEHVEQTVAPGDLMIKPKDISLKPTNPPKRSGIQHGVNDWDYQNQPSTSWYVHGEILD